MGDSRTQWVSPCGEYAVALCSDIPSGVMRSPNRSACETLSIDYVFYAKRMIVEHKTTRDGHLYYALVHRDDLPWEVPTVPTVPDTTCGCGVRVSGAMTAIGARHLCKR